MAKLHFPRVRTKTQNSARLISSSNTKSFASEKVSNAIRMLSVELCQYKPSYLCLMQTEIDRYFILCIYSKHMIFGEYFSSLGKIQNRTDLFNIFDDFCSYFNRWEACNTAFLMFFLRLIEMLRRNRPVGSKLKVRGPNFNCKVKVPFFQNVKVKLTPPTPKKKRHAKETLMLSMFGSFNTTELCFSFVGVGGGWVVS